MSSIDYEYRVALAQSLGDTLPSRTAFGTAKERTDYLTRMTHLAKNRPKSYRDVPPIPTWFLHMVRDTRFLSKLLIKLKILNNSKIVTLKEAKDYTERLLLTGNTRV